MFTTRLLRTLGLFALLTLGLSVAANAADYFYEDWEAGKAPLASWKISTKSADVKLAVNGGVWRTYHVKFNSGKYSKAVIYLGAYGTPSGRCWVDNIIPNGFSVRNPSFEDLDTNGMPVGWGLDSPGKWLHVSDKASDGEHSLMYFDPAYAAEMIRASQVIDVTPNTDYSYSFDFYMEDDFYGALRCSALAAGTSDYVVLGGMVEDPDVVIADRSAAGLRQCQMSLADGSAAISRDVSAPAGSVLEARASCRTKALAGDLALVVVDKATGESLARVQAEAGKDGWQQIGTRFVAPKAAVTVRIEANGKGEALVDAIGISDPRVLPPVQNAKWGKANGRFTLPESLAYLVKGNTSPMIETGLGILGKDLDKAGVKLAQSGTKPGLVVVIGKTKNAPKDKGDEAYYLEVSKNGARVESQTEKGAFYGLITLGQLLYAPTGGKPSIAACRITDWPDLPWRSIFSMRDPEWMARHKFNHAENVQIARFEEYLKYNIVLIPHENITHFPYKHPIYPPILQDPNYAEGEGQVDKLTLTGEAPVELSGRNIMRTKLTDIVVTSEDGAVRFKEGQDYRVIPGEIELALTCQFKPDVKPFAIARIPGGRIEDGQKVVATYEHAGLDSGELCLAEEEPQKVITEITAGVVGKYNLPFYAALESEAPPSIGKGPRCKATGLTPSQLMARFYDRIDQAVKSVSPKCRLFLWTDDLMDWMFAGRSGLGDCAKMVPKDAVMGSWYYGPSGTVQFNVKSAELWTKIGRDFTMMGWYDFYNIRCTAAVALWARKRDMPCLGTSSWAYPPSMAAGSLDFLDEVATCAWRGHRKGEPGYIDVAAEMAKGGE